MSKRSAALGVASLILGVLLLWWTDSLGVSSATASTAAGNQFPTVVGDAAPFLTLLLFSAGASLLVGFGATALVRGRVQLETRLSRIGTTCLLAGVVLSVNGLTLPWWQFWYQQNGAQLCNGTYVFYPWYLQYSGACPTPPSWIGWWYGSSSIFPHAGAVAIHASYGVLAALPLGLAAALVGLRRRSRGPIAGQRARWGFALGLAAAAANLGSALYFAAALPSALSADNGSGASFYPYDSSFWGFTTRAGTPSVTFYWGPDWTWVLLLLAAAFLLTGATTSYWSLRRGTLSAAPKTPPPGG